MSTTSETNEGAATMGSTPEPEVVTQRATRNRYPGTCARCRAAVAAEAGALLRVDGRSVVICAACAPASARPQAPTVRIALMADPAADGRASIAPVGFLGGEWFGKFRAAIAGSCQFRKEQKDNLAPIAQLGSLIERLTDAGFAVDASPEVAAALRLRDQDDARASEDAQARAAQIDARLAQTGGSLFAFQREGVAWLAPMSGAILADEMGLGKSLQVLISSPADHGVVVVCPKVAKAVWRAEAARWRPDLRVSVLEGRGSFRWPEVGELIVTNYDVLPSLDACAALAASAPACVLVADEAHVLKSGGGERAAQRAQAFKQLSEAVRKRGGRAWLVTGSPLLNHPPEIWNLLSMVGQTGTVFGTYDHFRALCGGTRGTYGTTWSGRVDPSVPDLLRRAMLRRLKSEVLPQLPSKLVEIVDVEIEGKVADQARAIVDRLAKAGVDVDAAVEILRASGTQKATFQQISKLRELLAKAKLAAAIQMIEELEEAGEPVVVMSAHRAPIDALASREGWATITGDTSDQERGQIAQRFQAGELRGVAGTLQAMGVAITLTRASEAIVIDPLWVPDLNRQGEDRIHRIGQSRGVRIRYLRADHALDRRVFDVCEVKRSLAARSVDAAAVALGGALSAVVSGAAQLEAAQVQPEDPAEALARAQELADLIAHLRAQRARGTSEKTRARAARKAAQVIASRGYAIEAKAMTTPPRGPQSAREVWAMGAVQQLAGSCDGALTEDEVGFNKPDSPIGKALADAVGEGLTDAEWQLAIQICWRYPRQVGRPDAEEQASPDRAGDETYAAAAEAIDAAAEAIDAAAEAIDAAATDSAVAEASD